MPRTRSADIREFGNISRLSSHHHHHKRVSQLRLGSHVFFFFTVHIFLSLSELGHVTNSCNQCIQHRHVNDCSLAFDVFSCLEYHLRRGIGRSGMYMQRTGLLHHDHHRQHDCRCFGIRKERGLVDLVWSGARETDGRE